MEIYLSEEERVEALKRWWKENRRAVVVGVLLGVAVILGWNTWQSTRLHKAEEASSVYQQLIKASEAKQGDSVLKLSERLAGNYPGTAYASLAVLFRARQQVNAGDLPAAQRTLQALLESTKDEGLQHLARLRLVSVLLATGHGDEALNLLQALKPEQEGEFGSQYAVAKGDVYAALNRPSDAVQAYQEAVRLGDVSPLLQLKLTDLGSTTSSGIAH
ncbi:tetratricopeptide repeat protein [Candidatus Methylospira mobilis]|uniref:YfgM family protein n=1 Tax=Candidatus Methylospira mobilis TaxID=1808979 RepID=UPI0018852B7E|nr:tetratricopeptide repeat protein [Candidatus Methylospira mobilis]WNV06481.1 tetratricopeptide repeat protein [Candidatus Methylospira mobilis]